MTKMKVKHNKKRNTLFLYETLVRELTKSIMKKDTAKQSIIIKMCKESFVKGSLMHKEKELYSALLETRSLDKEAATKLMDMVKEERSKVDNKKLFVEQTRLISRINKDLGGSPFATFVPGYKSLATIAQLFSTTTPFREKFLLEQKIVENMTAAADAPVEVMESIDNLAYKTFVKSFNSKYGESLLPEQRQTIEMYVMSFADNSLGLKGFLNEEIGRLKKGMVQVLNTEEVKKDSNMLSQTSSVVALLEDMSSYPIDDEMISKILKVQALVSETKEGRSNDS